MVDMLLGAAAILLAGELSPIEAFWSINLGVMIFLLSQHHSGEFVSLGAASNIIIIQMQKKMEKP